MALKSGLSCVKQQMKQETVTPDTRHTSHT